ncbi:MAG: pro-sigmaK processing inhibitor BofA family protein [Candidatus Micrarchaeota archaeon]|nr:pro-sigmaK processing inhibitor BofA family protein [Candidatus Micrarchaeota archaeon]
MIIVCIFLVIYIIFALGKLLFGLLINLVLGFISIFALNALFGLGIAFSLLTIVLIAIFGLPAVAVIVALKLLGITI